MMVKNTTTGAKAPSSPFIVNSNIFCNDIPIGMIDWYYRNSNTIEITIDGVNGREVVINIVEKHGENIRTKSFTIGPRMIERIKKEYEFYHG